MTFKFTKRAAFCVLAAVAMSKSVWALNLTDDLSKALSFDPSYQSALAEKDAGMATASQAGASYLPQLNYNTTRLPTDVGNRKTTTITQPVFDLANFATMMQANPRRSVAEANLLTKQQDLATRLLKAADAIIVANENIRLNKSKMDALNQQSERAKKLLEAGQGTITDQRDIDVKAAQARSQQVLLETQLLVAAKQYAAITGESPNVKEFVLPADQGAVKLRSLQEYVDEAMLHSPQILLAKSTVEVNEWDYTRAKGALAPTIVALHSRSTTLSTSTAPESTVSYSGMQLNYPLSPGGIYGLKSSAASLEKVKQDARDAEAKARVEVERLLALVSSGVQALAIQKDAIAAAELSVEANTKSYQGGVRSQVDVLNAIQTLYQVKSDYANAVVQQAENLLALLNLTNSNVVDVFAESSKFLLAR